MTHRSGHDHDTYSPIAGLDPNAAVGRAVRRLRHRDGRRAAAGGAHGRRALLTVHSGVPAGHCVEPCGRSKAGLGGTRSNRALQVIQEPTCVPIGFPWSPGLDDAPRERAR